MPLVSVIIPNFNNEKWLSTCIESCLKQKGDFSMEVIVVDDQSTDDSWNVLNDYQKAHPQTVFIYKNPKKGGNHARNFGYSKSSGHYIQWLDSDDVLLADKLDSQIQYLKTAPHIDVVYSDWRMDYYEEGEKIEEKTHISQPSDFYLKTLILDNWQPNLSYLMRRSIAKMLDEKNGWNPQTKVGQDREYFNLAAIYGANFAYVPGVFSVYNRWSSQTVSKIDYRQRLELSMQLDDHLINEIETQQWIPTPIKRELQSILKTYGLKSCYYRPNLRILHPLAFGDIQWHVIHYKMRLVIPFIWIYQMGLYYITKWLGQR